MFSIPSRRRFIGISAAAAGLSLLPLGKRAKAGGELVIWQGQAMGAVATLQIHHHDRAAAQRLIARALSEVRRLERVFSLYRDDSALSVLNREGFLLAPPPELVTVLNDCRRYFELTRGRFDPSVQALWTLYRDHFSRTDADPQGPPAQALSAALARVGFDGVAFNKDRIALLRSGMALTLNGIAQGFATDRIVNLLRSEGIASSLVDMGESRALGKRPDGSAWQFGIADPDRPERIGATLEAIDQAVATSGAYGFRFDSPGRFNHLFDPRTGECAHLHRSVTVVMPTATAADALSTAFSLMAPEDIALALGQLGEGEVRSITASGEHLALRA
ncbi:FAD:protein FMN transferase [Bosea sp. (in: a-proteobacteria)]|uniref:FAD:protein FMN transferase n=1 Tax=Bosea sp. (in: a-proteobacteria) TaxID=1871050 RepID=UPI00261AE7D8|nr:FAD:protein FMN transferase [Bosea sp. (in: a-proteobacteria)]MCO5091760.1 FAD:protein FMN transferase [Bosea sp. (in: a-proteobacteria)]